MSTLGLGRLGTVVLACSAIAGTGCAARAYYARDYQPAGPGGLGGPDLVGRVILLGDAGVWGRQAEGSHPGHARLPGLVSADARLAPERTTVLYLGDNVYQRGLPPELGSGAPSRCVPERPDERQAGERSLTEQLNAAASTRQIFIPGNHDWWAPGPCAAARHEAQARFLEAAGAELAPRRPCPGPQTFDVDGFRVVAFNSEWLLREDDGLAGDCASDFGLGPEASQVTVRAAFLAALEREIAGAGGRPVILASHHPIRSHGEHGGHLNPKHLFLDFLRWAFIRQDLRHPRYARLIADLDRVVDAATARDRSLVLIHAAGHDHDIEVQSDEASPRVVYLVSGSASKLAGVGHGPRTRFSHATPGYVTVDRVLGSLGERIVFEVVGADGGGRRISLFSEAVPFSRESQ